MGLHNFCMRHRVTSKQSKKSHPFIAGAKRKESNQREQEQLVVSVLLSIFIVVVLFYYLSENPEVDEFLPSGHLFDPDILPSVYGRLSKIDAPESVVAHILDEPIETIPPKLRGKQPPPDKYLLNPPTLRQLRQAFSSSEVLDLSRPWGSVYEPNRIGCMVPTVYPDKEKQWKAIASTWGPLCDVLLWIIDKDSNPPKEMYGGKVLTLEMERSGKGEERNIWEKVWRLWLHVASSPLITQAEWWLKVDDDTFFSPVNLKGFTRYLDPEHAFALGHTILWRWGIENIVFNSGACYVLSRGALFKLKPGFETIRSMPPLDGPSHCIDRSGAGEDPTMGVCLRQLGINPLNTLDENLRNRFLTFRIEDHESSMWSRDPRDGDSYYWRYRPKFMGDTNTGCCSEYLISSHGYKGPDVQEHYEKLHERYNQPKDWDALPLPPRPRWFLYDPETLWYKIDEYRNAIEHIPGGQRIYAGPEENMWCYNCKSGDRFWVEEIDADREGRTLLLGGGINMIHSGHRMDPSYDGVDHAI